MAIENFISSQKEKLERKIEELKKLSEFRVIDNFPNYLVSKEGNVYSLNKKSLMIPTPHDKYMAVTLSNKGKRKTLYVHRLVASAFLKKPKGKDVVNHKDGNKVNNHVSNLEWCTTSENAKHSYKTRTVKRGEDVYCATISEDTAKKIKHLLKSNMFTNKEICEMLDVKVHIVSSIKRKRTWKHLK